MVWFSRKSPAVPVNLIEKRKFSQFTGGYETKCCEQKGRKDTSNFDNEFTKEAPKLTPTDRLFIMNLDQTEFQGFSFTNPEFIVSV